MLGNQLRVTKYRQIEPKLNRNELRFLAKAGEENSNIEWHMTDRWTFEDMRLFIYMSL